MPRTPILAGIACLLLTFMVAASGVTLCSTTAHATTVDRIVAIVNGEIVTLFELQKRLKPLKARYEDSGRSIAPEQEQQLRKQLLDSMIEQILLRQRAEDFQITIADAELDKEIESLRRSNGLDEDAFRERLKLQGLTVADLREQIREQLLVNRLVGGMVRRKIAITDEQIAAYYNDHIEDYRTDATVHLGLILVQGDAEEARIREAVQSGEMSFADAARQFSRGPAARQGGDMGELKPDELAPAWREAIEGVEEGGLGRSFRIGEFNAILHVASRSVGAVQPMEEVREEIREILVKPLYEERYNAFLEDIKEGAIIEYKL